MKQSSSSEETGQPLVFQERPLICLIDMDEGVSKRLEQSGFNCTTASFGTQVRVPNKSVGDKHFCLLRNDLPSNLHEYDILVIDLEDKESEPYNQSDHLRTDSKHFDQYYFISQYPQTVFDPRPHRSLFASEDIAEIQKKPSIIIVFADELQTISYFPVQQGITGISHEKPRKIENYSFHNLFSTVSKTNKYGHETAVVSNNNEFRSFLQKYNDQFYYAVTFRHAKILDSSKGAFVPDPHFYPLVTNLSDEIVSFAYISGRSAMFVFPKLDNKDEFMLELFQTYLPTIWPEVFPFNTKFLWLEDDLYRLPNETKLLSQKASVKEEYEQRLKQLDGEIEKNRQIFQFLHSLLTETGEELVKTVKYFLHWLGFDTVINYDEVSTTKEEDLQIEFDQGLLVIEVKGIGGTSKDSECSQISKFKHRREKERGAFDVFALYIVNHQRYQAPENRLNPPFTEKQIQDAEDDERGLLTTYELFKLYFAIEAGIIEKQDARQALLGFGLVTFVPSNVAFIGEAKEIHHNGLVGIFSLESYIRKGEELIALDNGKYKVIKVVGLKDHDHDVAEASGDEIGIKFSEKISFNTKIWKRISM